MLFSNDQIAQTINHYFEPVWVNVRDVPLVKIDFGNGRVVTRTLHGNIASYLCTPDGRVMDVLPGVFDLKGYSQHLGHFVRLHNWMKQPGADQWKIDGKDPIARMKRYHEMQAETLAKGKSAMVVARAPLKLDAADFSKVVRIEFPLKLILQPAPKPAVEDVATTPVKVSSPELDADQSGELFEALVKDAKVNSTSRKLLVHRHLAEAGMPTPDEMTRWLYREVLDADLDDPYLGLGKLLFATYPFRDEDVH